MVTAFVASIGVPTIRGRRPLDEGHSMTPDHTWDRMSLEDAEGDDRATMERTPSYDYRQQRWRDHSDHAHFETDTSPLMFCGADGVTCRVGLLEGETA
jgi:hypothetical protein